MRPFLSAAVGGLLLLYAVPGAGSQASPTPVGEAATSLAAWNEYCRRHPGECRVDPSEPLTVPYTRRLRRLLDRVNRSVNTRLIQQTDIAHRGVEDYWEIPTDGIGDCEDLQLLKRQMLVRAGIPRRALLLTVTVTPAGEGHAVLTVRTSAGDYILDNQNNKVLRWDQTQLRFVKRESQNAPAWVALAVAPMSPVTASPAR